jgi:hypothetical protein
MARTTFRGKEVTREQVLAVLRDFGARYPDTNDYDRWLEKGNYKYALWYDDRAYPPKHILSEATGISTAEFSGSEQFHRVFKQLTGSEKCQCRKARSQRNHLGYCYLAWVALKVQANRMGGTVYQVRERIFDAFLTMALHKPPIPAYLLT